jgi:hypothetical protein
MATSELREAWRCELNTHCGSATSKGITIQRIPLRDTGGADWRVSVKAVTPVAVTHQQNNRLTTGCKQAPDLLIGDNLPSQYFGSLIWFGY